MRTEGGWRWGAMAEEARGSFTDPETEEENEKKTQAMAEKWSSNLKED